MNIAVAVLHPAPLVTHCSITPHSGGCDTGELVAHHISLIWLHLLIPCRQYNYTQDHNMRVPGD